MSDLRDNFINFRTVCRGVKALWLAGIVLLLAVLVSCSGLPGGERNGALEPSLTNGTGSSVQGESGSDGSSGASGLPGSGSPSGTSSLSDPGNPSGAQDESNAGSVSGVPDESASGSSSGASAEPGSESPASSANPEPVKTAEPDLIEETLAKMTVPEKIGQLIVSRIPQHYEEYITDYHVGGFIIFKADVSSGEQLQKLIADMQAAAAPAGIPLMISVDEEGGKVSRLGHIYNEGIPPMLEIGQTGDTANAFDIAKKIGGRLAGLGIGMDFAPVADVWTNPDNTVIGDRAFSTDAETAAEMVAAAVDGFHDAGVLSVIKHFPGHGDTAQDSHMQIAQYPYGRDRFDTTESLPFKSGIAAGVDGVMVGHIATPEMGNELAVLDWMQPWLDNGSLPATFSDYWMQDVLRDEMGFDGLIITDGLEMGALTNNFDSGQIALGAFMAGADVLLIPPNVPAAVDALTQAYDDGLITDERLDASVRRILKAKGETG